MSDYLKSIFRTAVPAGLAILASMLMTALVRWAGVEISGELALGIVSGLAITLIVAIGRALERSTSGPVAWVGRLLLSLGIDLGQPVYVKADPDAVRPLPSSTSSRYR